MGSCCSMPPNMESEDVGVREGIDADLCCSATRPPPPTILDFSEHLDEVYQLDAGLDKYLGSSSLGTIFKMRHRKSHTIRAVKQIAKKNFVGETWKDEVETLQSIDHPHICKLHETWEDHRNVYIIMEFCRGGCLTNLANRHSNVNEGSIAVLVWQMTSALGHLHEHNIHHGDIKPEHWLFGEEETKVHDAGLDTNLKMIDFGFSSRHGKTTYRHRSIAPYSVGSQEGGSSPSSPVTTKASQVPSERTKFPQAGQRRLNLRDQQNLFCKAPEQLGSIEIASPLLSPAYTGDRSERRRRVSTCSSASSYTSYSAVEDLSKSDVWSIGVLAYFLLSGQSPFHGSVKTKDAQIRNARYVFMPADVWRPISSEAKNFIALCLQKDPTKRPSAQKALGLPWMQLALGVLEEYKLGAGSVPALRLSLMDPPLPAAASILANIDRVNRLNILEKAGVIATAQSVKSERLHILYEKFAKIDAHGEGVLSIQELFEELVHFGVPCGDLLKQVKGCDMDSCVAIEHGEFIAAVRDFQKNMQESAVAAVFRSFDAPDDRARVRKKDLCAVLTQENLRRTLADCFLGLNMERIVRELKMDERDHLSYEDFIDVVKRLC